MTHSTIGPNDVSKGLIDQILARSARITGVQLPVGFVRSQSPPPALVRMIQGGKGGEVRLKLYLTVTLLSTRKPHSVTRPITNRTWAELIGLPKPDTNGSRRISDSFLWLGENQYLEVERKRGATTQTKLLSPSGDGTPYIRPSSNYVSLPLGFWREQWITELSAVAVALLIILLNHSGAARRVANQPISSSHKREYGLSPDSWTRGSKELQSHGLIEVSRTTRGNGLETIRSRNSYSVIYDRLNGPVI
jgi:hypothetical protein